jgi:uncharacterized membrane protein
MAAVSKFASEPVQKLIQWQRILVLTLAFWLSCSLFIDLILMPSLYAAGMMTQPSFAAAGYGLFWIFNRLQLVLAAIALSGTLVQHYLSESEQRSHVVGAGLLFLVTLIFTYLLAPQMSVLGLNLNWFGAAEVPIAMTQIHVSYWLLEALKLGAGGWLVAQNFD